MTFHKMWLKKSLALVLTALMLCTLFIPSTAEAMELKGFEEAFELPTEGGREGRVRVHLSEQLIDESTAAMVNNLVFHYKEAFRRSDEEEGAFSFLYELALALQDDPSTRLDARVYTLDGALGLELPALVDGTYKLTGVEEMIQEFASRKYQAEALDLMKRILPLQASFASLGDLVMGYMDEPVSEEIKELLGDEKLLIKRDRFRIPAEKMKDLSREVLTFLKEDKPLLHFFEGLENLHDQVGGAGQYMVPSTVYGTEGAFTVAQYQEMLQEQLDGLDEQSFESDLIFDAYSLDEQAVGFGLGEAKAGAEEASDRFRILYFERDAHLIRIDLRSEDEAPVLIDFRFDEQDNAGAMTIVQGDKLVFDMTFKDLAQAGEGFQSHVLGEAEIRFVHTDFSTAEAEEEPTDVEVLVRVKSLMEGETNHVSLYLSPDTESENYLEVTLEERYLAADELGLPTAWPEATQEATVEELGASLMGSEEVMSNLMEILQKLGLGQLLMSGMPVE